MAEFSCTTDAAAGTAVIHAFGDVDLASADLLWEELLAHLLPGARLVLDCSGIDFCDSTGLRVLVRAHHHAVATGADFALTGVDGPVDQLIKLAGIAGLLVVVGPASRPDGDG